MTQFNNVVIHKTSIVDDGASIGRDTKIWHWVHICSKATIGKNCSIGQNVFIGNNVVIGDNVKIQNNVSVYDNVILEDFVFCGPSMVFTNVSKPRSAVSRKNEYQDTIVRKGATLGANSTIICGVEIGENAFIAAGALVNSDVKPYALMMGLPAIHRGWMSAYGERIPLPLSGSKTWICKKTNSIYRLNGNSLVSE
ncbi:acyltransferase [Prochlorococcus marinus]|uniref:N-acetyltransferase n=1 Tax=Prochlorococcus marinus XMU1408 TaxID=2213228 RepID=A0A318R625_PROMR|nr:acyltransferase [Prochlorococcus marinus]MBW3041832.1 N-acetyltransferase [Prochlorococcus marinus str. XMU1408]PYE02971.1 N-acetyltransferase [Prochlorococcus marinus XMU1408]